ncbi:uncharacterized protein LOC129599481 [Paramacrobiotus metropolitanus]|uniref:uncharacterized protein LOC129599481 n=1 Tax=Paramacrobiotus metropolitanus TaxID=2943436 RepID=UPI0024461A57|nr:uncharacterized protein LOC129599481 [Paramacrobiotus metropolitanus]XP_055353695.1 uncharacterized protein LOC129599481 [Paramacrobiotus metropolitanus]
MWTSLFLSILSFHLITGSPCPITISELQLAVKQVNQEFIELRKHCAEPVDLSPYTLVFWRGHGGKANKRHPRNAPDAILQHRVNFTASGISHMNETFLVIGNNITATTTDFYTFEHVGWNKSNDFYLDRGNAKTNALVLYANLTDKDLPINATLNDITAHHDKIVDLLFYYHSGSAHGIKEFLFPEYIVGQPGTKGSSYYRLWDQRNNNSTDSHSFSFCCNDTMVSSKWPMGFKWTEPTPGAENNCTAEYCLDPKFKNFPITLDRCDVQKVENYFVTTTPPPTHPTSQVTTGAPAASTTPHSSTSLGISVGIPVVLVVLVLVGLVGFCIFKRRGYSPLSADGGGGVHCLNCFHRQDEGDRDRLVY